MEGKNECKQKRRQKEIFVLEKDISHNEGNIE